MEKFAVEKDVAAFIKKEFDTKYTPTWHCVVGRNFGRSRWGRAPWPAPHPTQTCCVPGSYVTHETKHFIYFYLGPVAVLLFKSG